MQEQYIKEKVKERYGKIALTGNSDCCCVPRECCSDNDQPSAIESTKLIGYDDKDIESIPFRLFDFRRATIDTILKN